MNPPEDFAVVLRFTSLEYDRAWDGPSDLAMLCKCMFELRRGDEPPVIGCVELRRNMLLADPPSEVLLTNLPEWVDPEAVAVLAGSYRRFIVESFIKPPPDGPPPGGARVLGGVLPQRNRFDVARVYRLRVVDGEWQQLGAGQPG